MAFERLKAASDTLTAQAAELAAAVAEVISAPAPNPTPVPTPDPASPVRRWFNDRAICNRPIPAGAQKHAQSDYWMSLQRRIKPRGAKFQLNLGLWTPAVFVAKSTDPRQTLVNSDGWTMDNVPIPAGVLALEGSDWGKEDSDRMMIILDPAERAMYCFGATYVSGGRLYAEAGYGKFHLEGPGFYQPDDVSPWGGGHSSNASLGFGLVRPEELRAGVIEHAIACCCDGKIQGAQPIPPALTTDDWQIPTPDGFPNGGRMRLDPTLNLDTLGLGKEAKIIARAMQVYGMFSIERGDGLAIYFESSFGRNPDPYAGMDFNGLTGTLLERMWVLQGEASYAYETARSWSPPQPRRAA
jgi:hypothetical protein